MYIITKPWIFYEGMPKGPILASYCLHDHPPLHIFALKWLGITLGTRAREGHECDSAKDVEWEEANCGVHEELEVQGHCLVDKK